MAKESEEAIVGHLNLWHESWVNDLPDLPMTSGFV